MHRYWPIANHLEQSETKRPDRLIRNNGAMWESHIPSTIVISTIVEIWLCSFTFALHRDPSYTVSKKGHPIFLNIGPVLVATTSL